MKQLKWRNPNTGELFIHREKEGRKELLYGIYGDKGHTKNHAVWNNGGLSYLREDGHVKADDKLDR